MAISYPEGVALGVMRKKVAVISLRLILNMVGEDGVYLTPGEFWETVERAEVAAKREDERGLE